MVVTDAIYYNLIIHRKVDPFMPQLSIFTVPDFRLKQHAQPVARVDADVRRLLHNMLDVMHAANGIGLAAPQVGILKRLIVIDISMPEEAPRPYLMANPEILWSSEEQIIGEEGCLSLPEQYAEVTRPARVRVRYLDDENEIREMQADGLFAKCIQHEIDHLQGILFVDHISTLKRGIIIRKLTKAKKQLAVAG